MGATTSIAPSAVKLSVSDDRLRAELEFAPEIIRDPLLILEQIEQAAVEAKLPIVGELRTRAERIASEIAAQTDSNLQSSLLALGEPASEAADGGFEWDSAYEPQLQNWQGDAPINYYSLNSVMTVAADVCIGRVVRPRDGRSGCDVYGRVIQPRRGIGAPLEIGAGLEQRGEGQLWTTAAGRVVLDGLKISIAPVIDVPQDVSFETGNIDVCIDVHIRGVVKAGFQVRTTHSLVIEGSIENATIATGGELTVRGGIYGGAHGSVVAGGPLVAAIADNAVMQVAGDVSISREMVNCCVRTRGMLRIESGAVAGGSVHARNGVRARVLGAAASTVTRISIGPAAEELALAARLECEFRELRQQALAQRAQLRPLEANLGRLRPQQRERAAELLARAVELESGSESLRIQRIELLRRAQSDPDADACIFVAGRLFPGVRIAIGGRESCIRHVYEGPLRVREQEVGGRTAMVLINERTNSLTILPTTAVQLPGAPERI